MIYYDPASEIARIDRKERIEQDQTWPDLSPMLLVYHNNSHSTSFSRQSFVDPRDREPTDSNTAGRPMELNDGMCFPYDLLLDILRRLPCHAIADSRRVCHAWRAMSTRTTSCFPTSSRTGFPACSPTPLDVRTSHTSSLGRPRPAMDVLCFGTTGLM